MRDPLRAVGEIRRLRLGGWLGGGVLLVAAAFIGASIDTSRFLVAYLEGFLIVLGLTLGCLGIWMTHSLVGGQWGDPIEKVVQAGARALPVTAVLFVPLLLSLRHLFPWVEKGYLQGDEMLLGKIWYLNVPFFVGRAIFFFVVWGILLWGLRRRSERATKDNPLDPWTLKVQNWSGGGALVLFLTATFAVVDWIMSLEPHFYSTIWGALVAMGWLLGSFSFCTVGSLYLHRLERRHGEEAEIPSLKLNDVGNLILMSIVLWMYMTFCQYLIIWSGQIKAEVSYYNARFLGGWEWFGLVMLFVGFCLPFVLLLMRRVKRNARTLGGVACGLVLMQWVWMVWLVGPCRSPMHIDVSWMTFVVPLAIAAVWLGTVAWELEKGVPPLPFGHEPELESYVA